MSEGVDRDEPQRPPPPWGDEITPLTEVCGGQYVLLHELARGDLSVVYRAKPTGARDPIAFKVIQPRYLGNETQVRRFRREAEILKRIEHPNVVRLIDQGTIEDGRSFVALELVVGRTLAEALSEAERMSPERTCRIARQLARALRAMHRAGIIHRDLQPSNILLIGPEDGERVKLVDFSEAGDVGAPARRVKGSAVSGASDGDPGYRPPEQVQKRPPQPTMDVFALGVIMFEMLAGEHPFAVSKVKAGPTIRSKAFDAPEVLLMLVADCIDKDHRERPPSMDVVLERLDKALLWMGVTPQDLGTSVDEDERTQPYTVADPDSPQEEERAQEVAEAAAEPKQAPTDEERQSTSIAGEVYASSGSFPVDDVLGRGPPPQARRDPPKSTTPEPEPRPSSRPSSRRRPGSDRPKEPATWDSRDPVDAHDDYSSSESRRDFYDSRGPVDSRDDDYSSSESRRDFFDSRGPVDSRDDYSSREGSRRGRGIRDSRDDSWEDVRPGRGIRDSRDESWDDHNRSSGDDSDSWDDSRQGRNQDGRTTDSAPRIDLDDLREKGAPTGPRFVVDTVAWTKQQPSANPDRPRKRKVTRDDDEPAAAAAEGKKNNNNKKKDANGSRRGGRSPSSSRVRPRPPTAAHAPVDPIQAMPRWVLPLLVMVIVVLAYAVWVVWTQ